MPSSPQVTPSTGPTPTPSKSAHALLVGAMLVAGVVINVVQYPRINEALGDAHPAYPALMDQGTADIRLIGPGNSSTVRERFGLYIHLAERAHGAHMVTERGVRLWRADLLGLGELASVTEDAAVTQRFADPDLGSLAPHVVARGRDRTAGEYVIAIAEDRPSRLIAFRSAEELWIVDARLLESRG